MEIRPCGHSDLKLSLLGLGCWSFGGGDYWGPQDESDVASVVSQSLDCGINYFDTASMYNQGRSEEALGRALGNRRHEAVIGTKVLPEHALSAEALRRECEGSLRRLGTDYIDIYMLHWPIESGPVDSAFAAMTALRDEGKIRAIGLSNHGIKQVTQAVETGACVVCNQLCYNLLCRASEMKLLPFCAQHGIGVLSYMPLLQGLLAGCYNSPDEVPVSFARTRHFRADRPGVRHGEQGAEAETFAAIAGIGELARAASISVPVLALAWIKARPEITTVLVGARTPQQLTEDIEALDITLSPDLVRELNTITQPLLDKLGPNPDYYETAARSRIR